MRTKLWPARAAVLGAMAGALLFGVPALAAVPTLSQYNAVVGLGQAITLYAQGSSTGVYMVSSSNPSVASIQTSGIQITVQGAQLGSTTASICYVGSASDCTNLIITVQSGSALAFNQNNLSLAAGQSVTVNLSGGSGTFTLNGNSNSAAVSAALTSSTTVVLTGVAAGSSNITVCDSSNCPVLWATVGGTSAGAVSFSTSNPSVAVGQTVSVTLSGGSNYYVSASSNSSAASQSLSGSVLTITGLVQGSTALTVCATGANCSTLNVSITAAGTASSSGTAQVGFGVSSPNLAVGQSLTTSIRGGAGFYISANSNATAVQASVSGSVMTLTGLAAGSATLTVCNSEGSCGSLNVTVGGSSGTSSGSTSAGGTTSGTSGNTASLLAAIQSMQAQLAQILAQVQAMAKALNQLAALAGTTGTAGGSSTAAAHSFTQFLSLGSQGAEVTALQQYLAGKGFYAGPVSGSYGSATEAAVKAFQSAHGITPAGYVGPSTRAALNAGN